MLQRRERVGICAKGSTTAVSAIGINNISALLIAFQPSTDEPSNILPSSKRSSRSSATRLTGSDTPCSLPLMSVNLNKTNLISFSRINFATFAIAVAFDMCVSPLWVIFK